MASEPTAERVGPAVVMNQLGELVLLLDCARNPQLDGALFVLHHACVRKHLVDRNCVRTPQLAVAFANRDCAKSQRLDAERPMLDQRTPHARRTTVAMRTKCLAMVLVKSKELRWAHSLENVLAAAVLGHTDLDGHKGTAMAMHCFQMPEDELAEVLMPPGEVAAKVLAHAAKLCLDRLALTTNAEPGTQEHGLASANFLQRQAFALNKHKLLSLELAQRSDSQ
jgi:hypothetical protein